MKVSCIIPAWNHAAFLGDALASLAAQTRKVDEVMFVDDCSTDDTFAVATEWSQKLRMHCMRNPLRMGVCMTLKQWLPRTTGDWIFRLDADDWLEPTYVERHVEAIAEQPDAAVVWCPAVYTATEPGAEHRSLDGMVIASAQWDARALESGNFIHCAAFVRRDALEAVGWCAVAEREEDWQTWVAIARAGYRGHQIGGAPGLRYRLHSRGHRNFGTDWKRA
jgi:glycosyltransferase involved in cell wall biosynthesis